MSLRENVHMAFQQANNYDRLMYPATHDEAQRSIARMVRQIQIICDQYGYDPTEWLNDETAQPESESEKQL